jgi:hypothetical protein
LFEVGLRELRSAFKELNSLHTTWSSFVNFSRSLIWNEALLVSWVAIGGEDRPVEVSSALSGNALPN